MNEIGFQANGFIIIDLVPENQMQTARHIEENLLDVINAENLESYCERYRPETEVALIQVFENIKDRIKEKGEISYIHIEGHSSEEYLCLLDGTNLEWGVIFGHFREINILSKNNLFVSSGTCLSAYAILTTTITKPCPLFGLLAPEKIIKVGSVHDGFIAFYKCLISSKNIPEAFNAFASVTNGNDFALMFSQDLFEKAAYKYISEHCMGKGKRKRIEHVVTQVVKLKNIHPKKIRKKIKKELNKPQALNLDRKSVE